MNVYSTMRIVHRYLGFFLAGIMFVYSVSGVVMIFRRTDFLKTERIVEKKIPANASIQDIDKSLQLKDFKFEKEEGNMVYFNNQGSYNKETGDVTYTVKELPFVLEKFTKLHKATTGHPLFFLNIFFGLSLFFFVISSFWMFLPKTSIFKKGIYFTLAGIVLTLVMLFV